MTSYERRIFEWCFAEWKINTADAQDEMTPLALLIAFVAAGFVILLLCGLGVFPALVFSAMGTVWLTLLVHLLVGMQYVSSLHDMDDDWSAYSAWTFKR